MKIADFCVISVSFCVIFKVELGYVSDRFCFRYGFIVYALKITNAAPIKDGVIEV